MIRKAFTGQPKADPKTLVQQHSDFTAEGAPPPGHTGSSRSSGAEFSGVPARTTPVLVRTGAAMPQASQPDAGIAFADWDILLGAVTARLRQAVIATLPHELNGATAPLQANVLECVAALDQLHAALRVALAQPSSLRRRDGCVGDAPVQAVTRAALDPVAAAQP